MAERSAKLITFYSYKGGVGRTFLLANVAALLRRWGAKVLCVDWDLEAPGLHHYLKPEAQPEGPARGLLPLIADWDAASGGDAAPSIDWRAAVVPGPQIPASPDRGCLDLLLAGDFSTTQVFAGTGSGFVNLSRPWGIGTRENGMGSLLFDPDGDGDLDALVTGILGDPLVCGPSAPLCDGNRLYRNGIPGPSSRVEAAWGLADGSWGWGMALFDADNDGDEDIVQTTGYFTPFTDGADEAVLAPYRPFALDPILFFEREETGFAERGAARGLADSAEGRTALAVDLDNDGDLDLALSHNRGTVEVWETVAPASNGWLEVAALDADCQPAVGATVTLESSAGLQRRWVQANSSYLGNVLAPLHFGLGAAKPLRLTVAWLDGTSTSVGVSSRNDRLTLTPAGISCP